MVSKYNQIVLDSVYFYTEIFPFPSELSQSTNSKTADQKHLSSTYKIIEIRPQCSNIQSIKKPL